MAETKPTLFPTEEYMVMHAKQILAAADDCPQLHYATIKHHVDGILLEIYDAARKRMPPMEKENL